MPRARALWAFGKWGFLLWEVMVMKLGGGSSQTCRGCVLGWRGKSEMGHCCEMSFWAMDKAGRNLALGQEGRGAGSCCIAVGHSEEVGVSYPPSARISREMRVLLFEALLGIPGAGPPLPALGEPITNCMETTILVTWSLLWPLVSKV